MLNATGIPLTDVNAIAITNVLAAEKQLMFDIHITGTNGNIRDVEIEKIDLNIFAAAEVRKNNSSPATDPHGEVPPLANPALFLGTVTNFNEPVVFPAGSFRRAKTAIVTTQVQLKSPGGNTASLPLDLQRFAVRGESSATTTAAGTTPTNLPESPAPPRVPDETDPERWGQIILRPYDLTVRGTLRYSLWFKPHVIRVCFIQRVDPTRDSHMVIPVHIRQAEGQSIRRTSSEPMIRELTLLECDRDEHPSFQ
ncbi:hypothetical protein BJ085DRAFT_28216 [Dimargaris cristalligena]|uniref:Uncharacterized protein n=1 Tax=Dimargaris cristalligena TaxID=215637 RepID=A0A4P9ZPR2_9FUNG|nr:hypothetical protein BJ085DRAFT_28216 [Dimargaris cristalligena]|eukprot:RKP35424.1 hypothetical protein BJ085DRAFT_28216 [Dimargaris cristalligena]